MKKSFVYFTLGTQRTAYDVDGWYPEKMGVSVAAALVESRLHVFTEHNMQQLVPVIESASHLVGWNIKGFDFKVLAGYPFVNVQHAQCVDLMEDVEKATGKRAMLGSVTAATLGMEPVGDGLEMVNLWKAGKIEGVIEDCCNVVLAIKALHEHARVHGELFYFPQNSRRRKRIKVDWMMPRKGKS